jgi:uncharacterized membrane protein
MRMLVVTAAFALLAGCGSRDAAPRETPAGNAQAPAGPAAAPAAKATAGAEAGAAARWDLQSSGEGVALALLPAAGGTAIRLFCPAGEDRLLVNVPGFRAVGSEERLSFGSGGAAHALVADTSGDNRRGGVSGVGPVPAGLATLVGGPVSASYGAQRSGPHPAPPQVMVRAFVAACQEGAASARPRAAPPATPPSVQPLAAGPCMEQDGKRLAVTPVRAVGTEPFWGARIEGRCVTYSHPEDQKGTRIWTRYAPAVGGGGTWSGALGGRRFELRLRPRAGCSDGMSDRRYPLAAELAVAGERRTGCAEPLT